MDNDNWELPNNQSWDTNDPDVLGFDLEETSELNTETNLNEGSSADPELLAFALEEFSELNIDTILNEHPGAETSELNIDTILNEHPGADSNASRVDFEALLDDGVLAIGAHLQFFLGQSIAFPWQSYDDFDRRTMVFLQMLPRIEQTYRRLDFDRQLLVTAGREADRYYDALTRQAYEDVSGFLAGPSNQRSGRPPALGQLFHQLVASTTATENDVIIGGFINERQNYATMEYDSWIEMNQTRYSRARPADRAAIRDEIIWQIYSKPGHFLKFYGERRFYIELTHIKVVEKVEQDLSTRRVSSFIRNNNSNPQRLAIFGAPR